jgi:hypothetical protein
MIQHNILSAKRGPSEQAPLRVTTDGGKEWFVQWPGASGMAARVQGWIDEGNSIAAHQRFANIEQAREHQTRAAYRKAKALLDDATADYSPAEMAAWTELEAEARAVVDDGAAPGRLMADEVAHGKRSVAVLASTVIAKADALRTLRSAVIAARTALADQIAVAALPELESLDPGDPTHWPS